jgi:peptidoglycan/LPS O-acetylase OafA/YrhL
VLGIPLAAKLMSLPVWFYWEGIPTPDWSLIPRVPASVGFGTAFVFGWLVHRSTNALEAIAQRWVQHLVFAVVATGWLLHSMHAEPMAQPGVTKTLFALTFGVALWSWVLGLTGTALRFLSNYSAARRYIADASYWIYLAHLPVVVAFQVWVGHWPLHWSVKYPFILVASFTVLFLSYHYLVRPTFIGALLNGRKYWRKPDPTTPHPVSPAPSPASPPPADTGNGSPVAQMRGSVKRFGTTTALGGIPARAAGTDRAAAPGNKKPPAATSSARS